MIVAQIYILNLQLLILLQKEMYFEILLLHMIKKYIMKSKEHNNYRSLYLTNLL
jgi:hypothetical protein